MHEAAQSLGASPAVRFWTVDFPLSLPGLRAGVMNVRVNLKGIKDEPRAAKLRERVRSLEVDSERFREGALAAVSVRGNGR